MLEDRNNRMIFLWEINFILMQIWFIVWLLQHGRCEHTLFLLQPRSQGTGLT